MSFVSISSSGFKEEYEYAVAHCLCHVYEKVPDALMITDRINKINRLNGF